MRIKLPLSDAGENAKPAGLDPIPKCCPEAGRSDGAPIHATGRAWQPVDGCY
jgi:hypothetical protein